MEITTYKDQLEGAPSKHSARAHLLKLEKKIERLKYICDHLDPYTKKDADINERLEEFQLQNIEDPFELTNKLLLMMENTIEELEGL